MSIKRKLSIGVTAAVLGLGLGATVFAPVLATAQESGTSNESTADTADRTSRIREALAPLVEDGTISSAQADAVAAHLAETLPHRHGGFLGRGAALAGLEEAASLIGIETSELTQALRDGQSIADVANANNVDPQTVIDGLVGAFNTRIDEAVAAGRITEEQAVDKKANAPERIAALVNGELDFRPGFWVRPNGQQEGADAAA